ncbi:MAG: hypothetical protein FWH38_01040 [Treponema sp.]|nr:hypothetical protein [Treponema sp.]
MLILLTLLAALFPLPAPLFAAPYYSFMLDRDGRLRPSPDLYEPSHVINFDVSGVNDLFIDKNDNLYIARVGMDGAEILVFDEDGQFLRSIGMDLLRGASGVFVDDGGLVYAADDAAMAVCVFSATGELLRRIERPVSALFGADAAYKPVKLAADRQSSLYILGEGNGNGIIQLDSEGAFLGYFGPNRTRISLTRRLQNLIFSPQMTEAFIRTRPSSMTNIAIDGDGLVYTVTKGDTPEPLKKINIAGKNLLDDSLSRLYGDVSLLSLESVAVDAWGNIFALSGSSGQVIILDSRGDIIGIFGAKDEQNAELGITVNPVSLGVNSRQWLYIADKGAGQIQVFSPSPFMTTLFSALALYREGRYVESEDLWRETLKRNAAIAVANNAVGLSLAKKEAFAEALGYFWQANNRASYSAAFWEQRQRFLMANLPYALIALIALALIAPLRKAMRIRHVNIRRVKMRGDLPAPALPASPPPSPLHFFKNAVKCLGDITRVFRHPLNAFYDVARGNTAPLPAAALLVAASAGLLLASDYATGFLFNPVNTGYLYNPRRVILVYAGAFFLFVASNFLVASITDGHGSLSQVFRGSALALAPVAFFTLPLILLSNALTLQEVFIFGFMRAGIFSWSGLLVIIMVMQVHEFDFSGALLNLALSVFAMAVIFVVAVVIFILGKAAIDFFVSLAVEALNRV